MTSVELTNLDKVLWPETGFTKGDMIEYYRAVAPALVPHLAGRAVTLARFPDGMEGPGWYQTNCRGAPPWMRTAEIRGRRGETYRFCVVDDVPSLLWVANMGTVELHPFLNLVERPDEPTFVVFDLDPGPPATIVEACAVGLRVREHLEARGLSAAAKTSGGKGLHVYVPLAAGHGYGQAKGFAREVAAALAEQDPGRIVDRPAKELRRGKVLVDWVQNDPGRSTAAPYSLRARARPVASTPVTWDEVDGSVTRGEELAFSPEEVVRRLDAHGDLFAPALAGDQRLSNDLDAGR